MKTYSHITASLTLLGFLLGSTPAYLYAAPADEDTEGTSATLLCGGASRMEEVVEEDGTPTGETVVTKASSWSFRNYNDSDFIRIDRIRIYDRDGVKLHDAMPPAASSSNGVDPSNVGPHSTIAFGSKILHNPIPRLNLKNPLQFVLDWSLVSGNKVLTLDGYVVRRDGTIDGTPLGIFTFDCRTINVAKGKGK